MHLPIFEIGLDKEHKINDHYKTFYEFKYLLNNPTREQTWHFLWEEWWGGEDTESILISPVCLQSRAEQIPGKWHCNTRQGDGLLPQADVHSRHMAGALRLGLSEGGRVYVLLCSLRGDDLLLLLLLLLDLQYFVLSLNGEQVERNPSVLIWSKRSLTTFSVTCVLSLSSSSQERRTRRQTDFPVVSRSLFQPWKIVQSLH